MKKIISVLLAAALVMSLAGCSFTDGLKEKFASFADSGAENKDETDNTDGTDGGSETNDITLGILDFDTFNPIMTKSTTVRDVCGFMYEPLFGMDDTMRTIPVLAESYVIAPDGTNITINLKHGVIWHDGSELQSDDAAYTISYIMTTENSYRELLEPVLSIATPDAYTVIVSFKRSVPDAVSLFIFPIAQNNSLSSTGTDFNPVGTGPFKFVYVNGREWLEAFDGHHDKRAEIDRVNLIFVPDAQKFVSLFNANEIDIANSDILDMSSYMPKSNATVSDFTSNTAVIAGFNTSNPMFSDALTRQAVSIMFDRDAITKNIFFSRASASDYAINPQSWLSFETRTKLRSDTWSASQLLKNAGWEMTDTGTYYRTSPKLTYLTFSILVNSDNGAHINTANAISQTLAANGINAGVVSCPTDEFNKRLAAHNYDMFVGEMNILPNNDMTAVAGSGGNLFGYANADVDTLIWQLGTVQNEADVTAVSSGLFELIHSEAPFATICFLKKSLVTSAKIKRGACPSIQAYIRNTEDWSVK